MHETVLFKNQTAWLHDLALTTDRKITIQCVWALPLKGVQHTAVWSIKYYDLWFHPYHETQELSSSMCRWSVCRDLMIVSLVENGTASCVCVMCASAVICMHRILLCELSLCVTQISINAHKFAHASFVRICTKQLVWFNIRCGLINISCILTL